jgi:OmpA-OmpF porin, OOP family
MEYPLLRRKMINIICDDRKQIMNKLSNIALTDRCWSSWIQTALMLFAILMLITRAAPARGEIRSGSYSVSPFIGGFLFEGNQDLTHSPISGVRFGYDFTKNWGVEALFDYVPTRYKVTDSNTNVFNLRIEGLYHLLPERKWVPFLAVGAGGMSIDSRDNTLEKNRVVLDYGAGIKYSLTERIDLRADVRHLLAFGSTYNNLEYTLGMVFYFGGAKAAAAGLIQERRQAPSTPVAPETSQRPGPIDLRATGVSESQIALAWNIPAGAVRYRIYRDGSPLATTGRISEYDAGLKADTRYCYRVSALDGQDAEFSQSNEACATTLAAEAVEQKASVAASLSGEYRLEDIHFDFDRFDLKPEAQIMLKRHAAWLIENSDMILLIIVEGHCDERGTAEYNLALGQRRANATARYLIDSGVDAKRITEISYGFERPVDPRHTEEAWGKNRRVHLIVTDKNDAKK